MCVLTSIKSGLRFYVNLEMDKKGSWRPQKAENVPTETFVDDLGPQVEIKRGPKSAKRLQKGRSPEQLAASKNRPGRDLCSKKVPGIILVDLGSLEQQSSVRYLENGYEGYRFFGGGNDYLPLAQRNARSD